eukprot:XP_011670664.1 PREDICTED: chromatin modification-related protein EAF7-like [Strongylocentrotus purpuratus]
MGYDNNEARKATYMQVDSDHDAYQVTTIVYGNARGGSQGDGNQNNEQDDGNQNNEQDDGNDDHQARSSGWSQPVRRHGRQPELDSVKTTEPGRRPEGRRPG